MEKIKQNFRKPGHVKVEDRKEPKDFICDQDRQDIYEMIDSFFREVDDIDRAKTIHQNKKLLSQQTSNGLLK